MDRNFGLNCIGLLLPLFGIWFDVWHGFSRSLLEISLRNEKHVYGEWKILIFLTKVYEQTRLIFCPMFQNWLQRMTCVPSCDFWFNLNCKEMSSHSNVWAVFVGLWKSWRSRHNFLQRFRVYGFPYMVYLLKHNIVQEKFSSIEKQLLQNWGNYFLQIYIIFPNGDHLGTVRSWRQRHGNGFMVTNVTVDTWWK